MNRLNRILLDPKGEEGGTPPAAPPAPAQQTPPASQGDPAEGWKALLAKMNNDATAVAQKLYDDNRTLRIKLRDARGNAKPDDGLVLQGDDVQAWNEYRALGKAGDLKQAIAERDRFRDEADGLRRAEVHKQAAEVHGYKASVLSDLIDKEKLPIEVKDEKVNGKPARVAYVKHADDKGKEVETKLPDYAEKHWSDYLPSLAPTAAPPPGTPRRGTTSGPPPGPTSKVPELYEGRNPFS
jgi:hypothetical protein